MTELVEKIEALMPSYSQILKSDMMKAYANGLKDALRAIDECVCDILILNATYYIILYENGDRKLPYIKKMRLVSKGKTGKTLSFSNNLHRMIGGSKDVVIPFRAVRRRVFSSYDEARRSISVR